MHYSLCQDRPFFFQLVRMHLHFSSTVTSQLWPVDSGVRSIWRSSFHACSVC